MKRLWQLVAWGFLGCVTLAMTPMGCANTLETSPIRGQEHSGIRVSNIADARFRQCVVDFAPEFAWYTYVHVKGNVEVDEEGRKLNVTAEGLPSTSPDFGACTRQVLQDMTVPVEALRALRTMLEKKNDAAEPSEAEGNLVGHPIVIVVAGVTLVLSDVAVQVAGITVLFTVTLALKDTVDALRRRPRWMNECQKKLNECLASPLNDEYGHLIGSQRCAWCFEVCRRKQEWPVEVINGDDKVSCRY